MNALTLTLAATRLTRLITEDEITEPLRLRVNRWATGAPYGSPRERLAYIPTCRQCSSIYCAAAVLLLHRYGGAPGRAVNAILALSQAALLSAAAQDFLENYGSDPNEG